MIELQCGGFHEWRYPYSRWMVKNSWKIRHLEMESLTGGTPYDSGHLRMAGKSAKHDHQWRFKIR